MAAEQYYSSSSSTSDDGESETLSEMYVDAFPSKIFKEVELSEYLQMLVWSSEMASFKESKADAVPVIPFKMETEDEQGKVSQKILFLNLIKDRSILKDRFDRLYDDAGIRQVLTGHADVDWNNLDKKLSKNPRLSHRYSRSRINKTDGLNRKGNADNRQSYVLRHMFLVKQHVTPGARTTGPDEFNIFQIYDVPLMLYLQISGLRASDGSFYPSERGQFKPYLLKPGCMYFVGPELTYISMSLQKTCYAVSRVTSNLFTEVCKRYNIFPAFTEENVFSPLSAAELEKLKSTVSENKRKRGRPAKSLDSLYWYKSEDKKRPKISLLSSPEAASTSKIETPTEVTPDIGVELDELIFPDVNEETPKEVTPDIGSELEQFILPDVNDDEFLNMLKYLQEGISMPEV